MKDKWTYSYIQCDVCMFIWLAVFEAHCEKLECPHCLAMRQFEKVDSK